MNMSRRWLTDLGTIAILLAIIGADLLVCHLGGVM